MGTGSYPGVKRSGRGIDHPLPSSAEAKERVELYLYFPSWPSLSVLGWNLSLLFFIAIQVKSVINYNLLLRTFDFWRLEAR